MRCIICGRKLTNPESIMRMMGPICYAHIHEHERKNRQLNKRPVTELYKPIAV